MDCFRSKWLTQKEFDKLELLLVDKGPIVRFDNYKWYFWDAKYYHLNGPYDTEEDAREACKEYANFVGIKL